MEVLLNSGTPATRALMAGAVTTAALWYIKPEDFFDRSTGLPRRATWATSRPDQLSRATPVPWYLAVAAVAIAVDLFV